MSEFDILCPEPKTPVGVQWLGVTGRDTDKAKVVFRQVIRNTYLRMSTQTRLGGISFTRLRASLPELHIEYIANNGLERLVVTVTEYGREVLRKLIVNIMFRAPYSRYAAPPVQWFLPYPAPYGREDIYTTAKTFFTSFMWAPKPYGADLVIEETYMIFSIDRFRDEIGSRGYTLDTEIFTVFALDYVRLEPKTRIDVFYHVDTLNHMNLIVEKAYNACIYYVGSVPMYDQNIWAEVGYNELIKLPWQRAETLNLTRYNLSGYEPDSVAFEVDFNHYNPHVIRDLEPIITA